MKRRKRAEKGGYMDQRRAFDSVTSCSPVLSERNVRPTLESDVVRLRARHRFNTLNARNFDNVGDDWAEKKKSVGQSI